MVKEPFRCFRGAVGDGGTLASLELLLLLMQEPSVVETHWVSWSQLKGLRTTFCRLVKFFQLFGSLVSVEPAAGSVDRCDPESVWVGRCGCWGFWLGSRDPESAWAGCCGCWGLWVGWVSCKSLWAGSEYGEVCWLGCGVGSLEVGLLLVSAGADSSFVSLPPLKTTARMIIKTAAAMTMAIMRGWLFLFLSIILTY